MGSGKLLACYADIFDSSRPYAVSLLSVSLLSANVGVNDRLFKRHGRWRSDKAEDGYVKDNLEALLSVSKRLEL